MPFKISKLYTSDNWTNLNLKDDKGLNWENGIKIIEDRFNSRFITHINAIKNEEFSGFIIMSIDCLLIETLMQFYLGEEDTDKQFKNNHWRAFRDFLKNSKHFSSDFKTTKICKTFYSHFRCGLLHQAETKKGSLIKICRPELLKLVDIKDASKGLIIDRQKFHDNLLLEFDDYLLNLKNNKLNYKGENLRKNAIRKMNNICSAI